MLQKDIKEFEVRLHDPLKIMNYHSLNICELRPRKQLLDLHHLMYRYSLRAQNMLILFPIRITQDVN